MPESPKSADLPLASLAKRPRADSKGEELYLVHLRRMTAPDPHPEDVEDDHDYEAPRKLRKTIGEELFAIHLERSRGLPPDYDRDDAGIDTEAAEKAGAADAEHREGENKAPEDNTVEAE